ALESEAHALLGWIDFVADSPQLAARHATYARAAIAETDAMRLQADVQLLELALRARRGSRRARDLLETAFDAASFAALDADDVRRFTDRAASIVTRGGARVASRGALAPEGYDLWMDASTGRVIVDGSVRVDLRARPILLRLLEALLAEPRSRFSKQRL